MYSRPSVTSQHPAGIKTKPQGFHLTQVTHYFNSHNNNMIVKRTTIIAQMLSVTILILVISNVAVAAAWIGLSRV